VLATFFHSGIAWRFVAHRGWYASEKQGCLAIPKILERALPGSGAVIDLSQWIAGNPLDVLANNFSEPASLFDKFPHKDVFIGGGTSA
jgi:hypothetical protein